MSIYPEAITSTIFIEIIYIQFYEKTTALSVKLEVDREEGEMHLSHTKFRTSIQRK